MSAVLNLNEGTLTYSEGYISSIAGIAATECYGVVGMAAKRARDGVFELLKRENLSRGVKVTTDATNCVEISLHVIVEYGISISACCESMIETVRYNVEKSTGLVVRDINVIVSGIRV